MCSSGSRLQRDSCRVDCDGGIVSPPLNTQIVRSVVNTNQVSSKSHPRHYMMHKYWGRKAHNLVAHYITEHSLEGDVVLDPFAGSGGAVIEAHKAGRVGVGVDVNPMTKLIVRCTLSGYGPDRFLGHFDELAAAIPRAVRELGTTACPQCGLPSQLRNAVWEGEQIRRVKGRCEQHGLFVKDSSDEDRELASRAADVLAQAVKRGEVDYPRTPMMDFVRRNGRRTIDELFSPRNLLQLSYLLTAVNSIQDEVLRDLYRLAFSSMLPNVSSMIPGDLATVNGRSGWQISKYWVPGIHTEKDVISSFHSRAVTIASGMREVEPFLTSAKWQVHTHSAERIPELEDDSVDFVFADPPYGDSIAYLGLSMMWNDWLNHEVDYDSEIVIDPYRGKRDEQYEDGLRKVFAEVARVLKCDRRMVVTFHSRKLKYWRILMQAILSAGFVLEDVDWIQQAVQSGTQGINRKNTLTGDFFYLFRNSGIAEHNENLSFTSGEPIVRKAAESLFSCHGCVTSSDLYRAIIPEIVEARAFLDDAGKDLDIDKILRVDYEYRSDEGSGVCGWVRKC